MAACFLYILLNILYFDTINNMIHVKELTWEVKDMCIIFVLFFILESLGWTSLNPASHKVCDS